MEARQGEGITLLIDENSNYGLTHYKPVTKMKPFWCRVYNSYKRMFIEEGFITIKIYKTENDFISIQLTKKDSESLLKCLTCAAERVNNYRRYCCKCEYYVDIEEYRRKAKNI